MKKFPPLAASSFAANPVLSWDRPNTSANFGGTASTVSLNTSPDGNGLTINGAGAVNIGTRFDDDISTHTCNLISGSCAIG